MPTEPRRRVKPTQPPDDDTCMKWLLTCCAILGVIGVALNGGVLLDRPLACLGLGLIGLGLCRSQGLGARG